MLCQTSRLHLVVSLKGRRQSFTAVLPKFFYLKFRSSRCQTLPPVIKPNQFYLSLIMTENINLVAKCRKLTRKDLNQFVRYQWNPDFSNNPFFKTPEFFQPKFVSLRTVYCNSPISRTTQFIKLIICLPCVQEVFQNRDSTLFSFS